MQNEVLGPLEGADLVVFTVWEPMLRADDEAAARRSSTLLPDPRVRHFWAPDLEPGESFQRAIDLAGEPAWDVYLVYLPGVLWDDPVHPPRPTYFMHQLAGRLPEPQRLDGARLRSYLEILTR